MKTNQIEKATMAGYTLEQLEAMLAAAREKMLYYAERIDELSQHQAEIRTELLKRMEAKDVV